MKVTTYNTPALLLLTSSIYCSSTVCKAPRDGVSKKHCPSFPSPSPKPTTLAPFSVRIQSLTLSPGHPKRTCTYYIHPSHQEFHIHRCNCYPFPFYQQSHNLDLQSQKCNITSLELIRLGRASAKCAVDAYPFHLCHSLPFQSHLQQWNSGIVQYIDAL